MNPAEDYNGDLPAPPPVIDTRIRNLWAAVLLDAMRLVRYGATPCRATELERAQARWWLRSRRYYPGSFVWCCALLDLDPTAPQWRYFR